MNTARQTWLVHTGAGVHWFVTAYNAREAILKVLFWSDSTESAVKCEAI